MSSHACKYAVGESWIPGAASGLFAAQNIAHDEVVCEYFGKRYTTADALKLADKSYLMRLGEQMYVDSREQMDCMARYINDCRNPLCYNVRFDKDPSQCLARIVAIRDIDAGEELFCDYGKWYWLKLSPCRLTFMDVQKRKQAAAVGRSADALSSTVVVVGPDSSPMFEGGVPGVNASAVPNADAGTTVETVFLSVGEAVPR
jgi:uncharacterized protein